MDDRAAALTPVLTSKLCQSIKVVRPASSEIKAMSDKTAAVIVGNNEARVAWGCAKLTNEAA